MSDVEAVSGIVRPLLVERGGADEGEEGAAVATGLVYVGGGMAGGECRRERLVAVEQDEGGRAVAGGDEHRPTITVRLGAELRGALDDLGVRGVPEPRLVRRRPAAAVPVHDRVA